MTGVKTPTGFAGLTGHAGPAEGAGLAGPAGLTRPARPTRPPGRRSAPRSGRLGRRLLSPILAGLLVGGCAVGPDYRRPAVEIPEHYQAAAGRVDPAPPGWKRALHGRTAGDVQAGAAIRPASTPAPGQPRQGPAPRWWALYGDDTLAGLLARVEVDYPGLVAAEARYRQARALVDSAAAGRWPQADIGLGYSRGGGGQLPAVTRNARATVDIGWEPDLWGRLRRNIEANEAAALSSAEDLAALRLSTQATLATAYWQLRSTDALKRLLESTVAGYRQSVQVTRNRYEAGVVPRSDVTQAETQLLTVEAQLIEVGITRAQTGHAIAVLLGRPPSAFTLAEDDRALVVPEIPVGLPSELLERRPDVASAEYRVAAANATIGVARAAWFPTLQLQGTAGTQAATIADLFSLPHRVWSLGPVLAQTLLDGGARRARDAQAVASHDEASANYRLAVLTAFQEVEDALVAVQLLAQEERVQQLAGKAAADALEQVTNQYRAGTVSILNLITAQATLLQTRRTLVDLRQRQLVASVQLIKATGGGW